MEVCHLMEKKSGQIRKIDLAGALEAAREGHDFVWIDLFQPEAAEPEALNRALNVHELTIEDLQSPRVRPKAEEFDDHLFVVFKALDLSDGGNPPEGINLNLLLFRNTLVSAHLKPVTAIRDLTEEVVLKPFP